MSQSAAASPVQQLVSLIREATGNVIPPARVGFLEDVAERRAHARGYPGIAEYVEALAGREIEGEWGHLISLVTIKESYFFRAPQQFEVIRQQVLPVLVRARSAARSLRIWSAACARGEEPSTLAILLSEEPSLAGWEWTIVATDLDEEALAGARLGLYGERAVSQVPPALLERWFTRRGKLYELDPAIRSRIQYQALNLSQTPFALPFAECDLVLLRNVLIYFRRPLQRLVVSHIARLLAPQGYLFLGASETLWQIQDELESVDLGPCFAYRHRTAPRPEPAAPRKPKSAPAPAPPVEKPGTAAPPVPKPAPAPAILQPLGVHERLLAAARDLAANRIDEAAKVIGQALAADPSEPAAHALEGFLNDLRGRTEDAVSSYRAALYLDPALFQVRVLLADCLLRLGHRDRAEHQFREVLTLLAGGRERALILFEDLPLPDRERAQRRCRQVLKGQ
ncbi:MAG TPA: CheR family methyltransferase [Thermoanaerobaculia bacterium]|jgi:chemotaxis protein methyltransferase CheR|nr:CheR family methyltransferase [Thermoanaerobaculia bacterium]